MSRLLYVDAIGGAAGDMLLAAVLDAGAPERAVRDAVEAVLPGRFRFQLEPSIRRGYRAAFLRVEPGPKALTPLSHRQLLGALDRAELLPAVKSRARAVLERLGAAEARVHGLPDVATDDHPIGDEDTLFDVVGFAAAIEAVGVGRILVSPLPLGGGGMVEGLDPHPPVPLPAPAVLALLEGFEITGSAAPETVTPTAAAILAALGEPAATLPSMRLEATGYGAGLRDPEGGRPNVVRVLVGREVGAEPDDGIRVRDLALLEANLDDLSPELVADAVDALLGAGALDAWIAPIMMKKGRPGSLLSALCDVSDEARVRLAFFESTSTFGVRTRMVTRAELERRSVAVSVSGGTVRVKVGLLGDRMVTASPEHDDVADLARRTGRSVRETFEEAATAARVLRLQEIEPS